MDRSEYRDHDIQEEEAKRVKRNTRQDAKDHERPHSHEYLEQDWQPCNDFQLGS